MNSQEEAPWENFERLNLFSGPLYRMMWAHGYPQAELLDDIENHHVYGLLCACSQLRFMVADCSRLDGPHKQDHRATVKNAIEHVGYFYNDLLQVAGGLSIETDNSHRLVANIRGIIPHYYAVILEFHRRHPNQISPHRLQDAVQSIMELAAQDYKHGGDESMVRVSWPLFVAAMVTDKPHHQTWFLGRLQSIGRFGKNYERAAKFLAKMLEMQDILGRKVGYDEVLQSTGMETFVI
jgi:hypothetical protein